LAYAVIRLTALNRHFMDPWLLIGMIFNGCQPTAMASNVLFTRQGHGAAVLTVVETTIGNLIGPFVTPVLIRMYLLAETWFGEVIPSQGGGYGALYRRVFMQFGLSIYLPMAVGQLIRWLAPRLVERVFVKWKMAKVGSFCMLAILWATFDRAFATGAFEDVRQDNLVFIVFITMGNWALWLGISVGLSMLWLGRKETVAVAMCVPAKTLALGMPLSFLMFEGITALEEAKIQLPMLIFQVEMLGLASISTLFFRRWVDADERRKERGVQHDNRDGRQTNEVKGSARLSDQDVPA
jgi:solute carrier family 10 (sodium/bile acid cotransporter), member 7